MTVGANGPVMRVAVHDSLHAIPEQAWAALDTHGNPFLERAFLLALEDSGAVGPGSGWTAHILALEEEGTGGAPRRLLAVVPAWLKAHSWGEYVFDHHWAEAYARAGGRYYPKLLVAVPFTPVTGPRILLRADLDPARRAAVRRRALAVLWEETRRLGLSGAHIDFLTGEEAEAGAAEGWLVRMDQQFHWTNRGWDSFEAFLASLKSARRKQIRRERAAALTGLEVVWRQGVELGEDEIIFVHRCYRATARKRGGWPYLNLDSFRRLFAAMGERLVVTLALDGRRPIAMALHALGRETLYGRYWGAVEERPFLHFALCYYEAIAYAIRHAIPRVEAGAQGPHKLQRGYAPQPTFSLHRFTDARMQQAVAAYLEAERREVALARDLLARHLPYRRRRGGAERPI